VNLFPDRFPVAFNFSLFQRQTARSSPASVGVGVALVLAIIVVTAVAGPFGTYSEGVFGVRLTYWAGVVCVSIFLARGVRALVARWFGHTPRALREGLVLLGITAVFTPLLYLWTDLLLDVTVLGRFAFWHLAAKVLAVCVLVSILRIYLPRLMDEAEVEEVANARLMRRLPDNASHEVLRLSADGHVVQVVTVDQQYDLRIRFSDAVEEMDAVEGYCTHRSHWVARAAVSGSEVRNGRPALILHNGDVVPVSRKYRPDIEAAGLL
jgi:hypothetical protein